MPVKTRPVADGPILHILQFGPLQAKWQKMPKQKMRRMRMAGLTMTGLNQRAENGGLDPSWLDFGFWGAPIFRPEVPKPFKKRSGGH